MLLLSVYNFIKKEVIEMTQNEKIVNKNKTIRWWVPLKVEQVFLVETEEQKKADKIVREELNDFDLRSMLRKSHVKPETGGGPKGTSHLNKEKNVMKKKIRSDYGKLNKRQQILEVERVSELIDWNAVRRLEEAFAKVFLDEKINLEVRAKEVNSIFVMLCDEIGTMIKVYGAYGDELLYTPIFIDEDGTGHLVGLREPFIELTEIVEK
jgi:hypothetical protein